MSVNIQVIAPQGYADLLPDERYILLMRPTAESPAIFVHFTKETPGFRLHALDRDRFIQATDKRLIHAVPPEDCWSLPPWLNRYEGLNIDAMISFASETDRDGTSKRDTVESRIMVMHRAVQDADMILTSCHPEKLLNKYARGHSPRQHSVRFKLWFFVYLAFGRNQWSLLPAPSGRGTYDRTHKARMGQKFGRSPFGRWISDADVKRIVAAFSRCASPSKSLIDIYDEVVRNEFGAIPRNMQDPSEGMMHPKGLPFPTYRQFSYRTKKHVDADTYRRSLYGNQRARNEMTPSHGTYASGLTNLVERVYVDARASQKVPVSYLTKEPLQRLYIVEIYDGLSKICLGTGFTLGSETTQGYLNALFCMAIPKSRFGEIIGYQISNDEWPSCGLPASLTSDRGPGCSDAMAKALELTVVARIMTPSQTPQSNSPAEGKHPTSKKQTGAPRYEVSNLNPVEMVKEQVQRVLGANKTSSAADVATPSMIMAGKITGLDVWRDLSFRMRNDEYHISFDDAVRWFLAKDKVDLVDGFLIFKGSRYSSPDFQQTSLFKNSKSIGSKSKVEVTCYYLDFAVRKLWVEADQRIVEVDYAMGFRDDDTEFAMSLPELLELEKQISSIPHKLAGMRQTQKAISAMNFKAQTGKTYNGGETVMGVFKPRRPVAVSEAKALKNRSKKEKK